MTKRSFEEDSLLSDVKDDADCDFFKKIIEKHGKVALFESLRFNNTLTHINLLDNSIGNEGCKYLSDALKINNALTNIDLAANSIGVEGCKYLSDALKVNKTLTNVNLSINSIGNEGCKYLSDALKVNNTLTNINLGYNSIGNEGCKYLSDALKINNTLKNVDIENNSIGSNGKVYEVEIKNKLKKNKILLKKAIAQQKQERMDLILCLSHSSVFISNDVISQFDTFMKSIKIHPKK